MSLRKNKKGVEGLPLKYIIIALVAALVVGIALQFTGTLKGGILGTADKLNSTLSEQTACELDFDDPEFDWSDVDISCNATLDSITLDVDIKDDCGISGVSLDVNDDNKYLPLTLTSGTDQDGAWSYDGTWPNNIGTSIKVEIHAYDKSSNNNDAWATNASVSCSI